MDMFKKGSPQDMANFRDITLADEAGKTLEGCHRTDLTQVIADGNQGATDRVHLLLRSSLDIAAVRKLSAAALFIDVVGAFAALQRALVMYVPESDESLAFCLGAWDLSRVKSKR